MHSVRTYLSAIFNSFRTYFNSDFQLSSYVFQLQFSIHFLLTLTPNFNSFRTYFNFKFQFISYLF
jgi:hypothetical protein